MFINILSVGVEGTWPSSFQWSVGTEQGEAAINWSIGSSTPICKGISLQWGWRSTGTGCPGGLWILLLWRYSSPAWMPNCAASCREPALQGGWTWWSVEVLSSPYNSVKYCYHLYLIYCQSTGLNRLVKCTLIPQNGWGKKGPLGIIYSYFQAVMVSQLDCISSLNKPAVFHTHTLLLFQ